MNGLKNFIKIWKRDGWNETWKQFKVRFYEQQTPERLQQQEIVGYIGSLVGLLLALIVTLLTGLWYLSIIMLFASFITYVKLKGLLKQKKVMKEIKEMYKE